MFLQKTKINATTEYFLSYSRQNVQQFEKKMCVPRPIWTTSTISQRWRTEFVQIANFRDARSEKSFFEIFAKMLFMDGQTSSSSHVDHKTLNFTKWSAKPRLIPVSVPKDEVSVTAWTKIDTHRDKIILQKTKINATTGQHMIFIKKK